MTRETEGHTARNKDGRATRNPCESPKCPKIAENGTTYRVNTRLSQQPGETAHETHGLTEAERTEILGDGNVLELWRVRVQRAGAQRDTRCGDEERNRLGG